MRELTIRFPRPASFPRDLAAEAFAIARGESVCQPTREHLIELVRLLDMRAEAIDGLTRGRP